jgi:helix-turn-helix protein
MTTVERAMAYKVHVTEGPEIDIVTVEINGESQELARVKHGNSDQESFERLLAALDTMFKDAMITTVQRVNLKIKNPGLAALVSKLYPGC